MLRVINCESLRRGWLEVVEEPCNLGDVLYINSGFYEVYGIATQEGSTTMLVEVEVWDGSEDVDYFQMSLFE